MTVWCLCVCLHVTHGPGWAYTLITKRAELLGKKRREKHDFACCTCSSSAEKSFLVGKWAKLDARSGHFSVIYKFTSSKWSIPRSSACTNSFDFHLPLYCSYRQKRNSRGCRYFEQFPLFFQHFRKSKCRDLLFTFLQRSGRIICACSVRFEGRWVRRWEEMRWWWSWYRETREKKREGKKFKRLPVIH